MCKTCLNNHHTDLHVPDFKIRQVAPSKGVTGNKLSYLSGPGVNARPSNSKETNAS